VTRADPDKVFALLSDWKRNVELTVVDTDAYTLALVQDVHAVFPAVHIVALSDEARVRSRAPRAGATATPPLSAPPRAIDTVVHRLLS